VTGAATNLNDAERAASSLLGRLLAREGYGLISGTWGGTDEIVTQAFVGGTDPAIVDKRIFHVANSPYYSSHSIRRGPVITSSPRDGYCQEAIDRADIGVVVSGRKGSKPTMDALARYGKPVVPLAWLGNDALACLLEILESMGASKADRLQRRLLLPFIDPASGRDETLSRTLGATTCRSHDIFISYHHQDTGPDAGRFAAGLSEQYGTRRVFIDYQSFAAAEQIEQLVAKAGSVRLLIAFIGRNWATKVSAETDFVRRELLAGLKGKAHIIPIFVDRGPLTESDVPQELRDLIPINGVVLNRAWWDSTMQSLEPVIDAAFGITRMTP
jgi:hypothetical protein